MIGERALRFAAQGLAAPRAGQPWLVVGGAEPYLALGARDPRWTVEAVHGAVATGELRIVPAVRGLRYLVPRAEAPVALGVARHLGERLRRRAMDEAGLTAATLATAADRVAEALAGAGSVTEPALRRRLPRSDGGKVLRVVLGHLELEGRVRRRPQGDRLDRERWSWTLEADAAPTPPLDPATLAALYARVAGPASADDLRAWSGLLPIAFVPGDVAPGPSRTVLLSARDPYFDLYAAPNGFDADLPPLEVSHPLTGRHPLGGSRDQLARTVVRDGDVVGVWGWDPDAGRVEVVPLRPAVDVPPAEVERVTRVFGSLGHGHSFPDDSDEALRERLELARRAA